MSLPSTQKAVVIAGTGGPEVLQFRTDYPVPTPLEGELLVKNTITSVNYIDTYFRTGLYPVPKPAVLGQEAVGIVVALGPGDNPYNFSVGDRVIWLYRGSYAQYSTVPQGRAVKIPSGIADEDALASFLSGMTVLALTRESYPVQKGEWVLVHAAAGNAGSLMTQVLKLKGAKVIGTAGGPEKVKLAKALGADEVIDYRSEEGKDFAKRALEITGGEGVSVVYDSVGKDTWEGSLEAVKRKGTVVWFGNASGPVPPLQLTYESTSTVPESKQDNELTGLFNRILGPKCVKVVRPVLDGYLKTREEFEYYSGEMFTTLQSGQLKIRIHKTYPLEEIVQAHTVSFSLCCFLPSFDDRSISLIYASLPLSPLPQDIESRKTSGKLLLKP
jgi:NADPH:quinone reductase